MNENVQNAVTGAASGAAAGTAISPGIGTAIGGVLGAAASFLGGILTNKSNKKINQQQLDFQQNMFNQTNAYNDYNSDIQRMLLAGLNPAYLYGNTSAMQGQADAMSAPNQLAMQNPAANLGLGETMANAESLGLQAKQLAIADKKADAEIENLNANTAVAKANEEYINKQKELTEEQKKETIERVKEIQANVDVQKAKAKEIDLNNKITQERIERDFFKKYDEQLLASISASTELTLAQKDLTEAERKNAIATKEFINNNAKLVAQQAYNVYVANLNADKDFQLRVMGWELEQEVNQKMMVLNKTNVSHSLRNSKYWYEDKYYGGEDAFNNDRALQYDILHNENNAKGETWNNSYWHLGAVDACMIFSTISNGMSNIMNAQTNRYNAYSNRINAGSNFFNAHTNRMNAYTNRGFLDMYSNQKSPSGNFGYSSSYMYR